MDWTVAIDNVLTERTRRCTLCSQGIVQHGLYQWEVHAIGAFCIGVVLCERCQRADPQRVQLTALLLRRYGKARAD